MAFLIVCSSNLQTNVRVGSLSCGGVLIILRSLKPIKLIFRVRGIGVAERANYIARVRAMANGCAASYLESREQLGFPLLREK